MIEEQARVLAVRTGTATLAIERQSACGSCNASGGCGTALLANWFPKRQLTLQVDDALGVSAGDLVVVGLDDGLLQKVALKLYALPLLGLLGGAVIGQLIGGRLGLPPELASILLGLLGTIVALLYLGKGSSSAGARQNSDVRLLRVVKHGFAEHGTFSVPVVGLTKPQNEK